MHNDITLANTTRGISLYIHLSIRSIASQQANGKNTSEAHHQPAQAICSTYLLPYINIKKSGKTVGNYRLMLLKQPKSVELELKFSNHSIYFFLNRKELHFAFRLYVQITVVLHLLPLGQE